MLDENAQDMTIPIIRPQTDSIKDYPQEEGESKQIPDVDSSRVFFFTFLSTPP